MDNSVLSISKVLLDLAAVSETVLYATPKGSAAMKDPKLDHAQRSLLERIDGFRSIEQLLAMSGDLIGVHAALGKLLVSGCASTDRRPVAEVSEPVAVRAAAPAVTPAAARGGVAAAPPAPRAKAVTPAKAVVAAHPPTELDSAKRVLALEAKLVFGNNAAKLLPRIEACRSIEDIYDLIVKFQQHLTTTGRANPDVFLDRLTKGIASARRQAPDTKRNPAP